MPVLTPNQIELVWVDSAGNAQHFPSDVVDGEGAPRFNAFLVYKDAVGVAHYSQLDVILAAIRDRLPSGGSATETTLAAVKADLDALLSSVATQTTAAASKADLDALVAKDFATQTTLAAVKAKTDNLDLALSALRDAIVKTGATSKTLADVWTVLGTPAQTADINALIAKLPAALDADGGLKVHVQTLPTGAATSAAQTTGNASLASVDGKLPAQLIGRLPTIAGWPKAGERFKYDIPATIPSGTLYVGWNAAAGAATSATTWTVRRVTFDANGNPNDDQVQANIAWDSRSSGWTA